MRISAFLVPAAASLLASPSLACVADPVGDFEPTYIGPHLPGLDITCGSVRLLGSNLVFEVTLAAPITTAESSYTLWGVNRGNGAPRLLVVGAPPPIKPDVLFDAIVLSGRDGVAELGIFAGGPPTFTLHPGAVTVDGNIVRTILPVALFPSNGFELWQYGYTSWSHYEADGAGFSISNVWKADFTSTFRGVVPEPATWAMLIAGFGIVGAAARRQRRAVA